MYFLFLITINSKFYQSLGLFVVPQCLICLSLSQHLPWQRRREQTQSRVLVLLDPSLCKMEIKAGFLQMTNLVAPDMADLLLPHRVDTPCSSWGELFCRQPLIIHPGFPPTWLCLVEQQSFPFFLRLLHFLLAALPKGLFSLKCQRVTLKQ